MKSKVIFSLAFMLAFSVATSFAQTSTAPTPKHQVTPEDRAKHLTDEMTSKLSLTEDQQKKAYDVNLSYAQKIMAVRKETITPQEKQLQVKSLMDQKDVELKTLFTPEQYQQWQQYKQQMVNKHPGGVQGKGPIHQEQTLQQQ